MWRQRRLREAFLFGCWTYGADWIEFATSSALRKIAQFRKRRDDLLVCKGFGVRICISVIRSSNLHWGTSWSVWTFRCLSCFARMTVGKGGQLAEKNLADLFDRRKSTPLYRCSADEIFTHFQKLLLKGGLIVSRSFSGGKTFHDAFRVSFCFLLITVPFLCCCCCFALLLSLFSLFCAKPFVFPVRFRGWTRTTQVFRPQ